MSEYNWLDEMIHTESEAVKGNSNNLKNKIRGHAGLNKVLDDTRKAVRSDKLTEKFPDSENPIPVKKRPRYLVRAIKGTQRQIREYEKICRGLAESPHPSRFKAKGKKTQSDRTEETVDSSGHDSSYY